MSIRCEDIFSHPEFRRLSSLPGIAVDLRYASVRNFVGRDLYGGLDCAWLHRQAAAGLEQAVARLAEVAPGHRLLVLDALRPHRVQIELWDFLDGTGLRQYVADPARGSIHSFGMALDATLIDAEGRELDMGSGFDEMIELSHPKLEARHLASGWRLRDSGNVLFLTYESMRADLGAAVDKIAAFMNVKLEPEERAAVIERSSFAYMKKIGHKFDAPGAPWANSKGSMMRRGESGGSAELLTAEQQRHIDDHWRAELARIGCDFAYDAAFSAASRR